MPLFWTMLGIRRPLVVGNAQTFQQAKEARLLELFPSGHTTAQLNTVTELLANGADPTNVKGIHWHYKFLPGLRRYRKERKEMFALVEAAAAKAKSVKTADGENQAAIKTPSADAG